MFTASEVQASDIMTGDVIKGKLDGEDIQIHVKAVHGDKLDVYVASDFPPGNISIAGNLTVGSIIHLTKETFKLNYVAKVIGHAPRLREKVLTVEGIRVC